MGVLYAKVGGTWQPILGNEVAIQTGQPAGSFDLWVDTDDQPPGYAMTLGAWKPIPLLSGAVEYSTPMTPQYRFEPYNVIRLRGWIKAATSWVAGAATQIAQMPAEALPGRQFIDWVSAHSGQGGNFANAVRMELTGSSGIITITPGSAYTSVFTWVSLDGVTYPLEA